MLGLAVGLRAGLPLAATWTDTGGGLAGLHRLHLVPNRNLAMFAAIPLLTRRIV